MAGDWRVYQWAELVYELKRRLSRDGSMQALADELDIRYRRLERELEEAEDKIRRLERGVWFR